MAETERQKLERELRAQEKADQAYYTPKVTDMGVVGQSGAMMDSHTRQAFIDQKRKEMDAKQYEAFRKTVK